MAKKRAKVGRPTVFTDEVIRKIEEVAALDGSVAEMAYYANIHPDSIYARLKENKEFSDRIQALRERPVLKARQTIIKSLDTPQGSQWYLSRKRKAEFAERIEQTGANGGDTNPEVADAIKELTQQLNELHRGTSIRSNGGATRIVGAKTPDKE